ncbi:hypothetical protein GCM10010521_25150 [Streptomyces rameus]|uniref:Uncharacterized protein n=1 Tax=Streptomyces rameus TaxID=68261 RepID=A0ABP6N6C2_9ACTN
MPGRALAAAEHQGGQRLAQQEAARRDHGCDEGAQCPAPAYGGPYGGRVAGPAGVRHQHRRTEAKTSATPSSTFSALVATATAATAAPPHRETQTVLTIPETTEARSER